MYPVNLSGQSVALREFRESDVDDALRIVGDPEVTDWLSFDPRTREQTANMLAGVVERSHQDPRTEYYLAVVRPGIDSLVGFARLGLTGVKAAKLGFAVAADEWTQGIATDAARTLTDFGFRKLGIHRISAAIGPENSASIGLVSKLGFHYEGRIRGHVYTNGAWRDSLLFSVLEDEWS